MRRQACHPPAVQHLACALLVRSRWRLQEWNPKLLTACETVLPPSCARFVNLAAFPTDPSRPQSRDDDVSDRPPPDPTERIKTAAAGSKLQAASPPPPEKNKAASLPSTKAIAAGDPKRLSRPPSAKGADPKRRRSKEPAAKKPNCSILQSLGYYSSRSIFSFSFDAFCCIIGFFILI
jgi:hypothetical protein